jgi:hypothetical protein
MILNPQPVSYQEAVTRLLASYHLGFDITCSFAACIYKDLFAEYLADAYSIRISGGSCKKNDRLRASNLDDLTQANTTA